MLLVDTMANATAIDYVAENSHKEVIHNDMQETVALSQGGYYKGRLVTDSICLDDDEDICIQHFTFWNILNSTMVPQGKVKCKGVIPFNMFKHDSDPNEQMISVLDYEDIFSNSSM